jgi:acetyl esterase/lipase
MLRRRAALLLAACAGAQLPARARQTRPARPARQDDSIAAAMNDLQVRVERDLAYGQQPRQRLDVYLPGSVRGPIVLIVHGGAWSSGDKRAPALVIPKVRHWTARGLVVASVNYRLLPDAHPLEQARDIARALTLVQRRAPVWGANGSQVLLVGHSAGAHLVVLLSADPALAREQGADAWLGTVALDCPVFDVPALMEEQHAALYDRAFGQHRAYWRTVSPLHVVARDAPPMLAVCSRRSRDACLRAEAFAGRARRIGVKVEVQGVDLGHMELDRQLGLPGAYSDSVDRWIGSIL